MRFSVITVTHKSGDKLSKYVGSFLRQHCAPAHAFEFIFVENSGDPGVYAAVAPLMDAGFSVRVLASENLGFGRGCNFGAEQVTGDVLLFINPDVQFLTPLDALAAYAGPEKWGSVRQIRPSGAVYTFDLLPEYRTLAYELFRGYRLLNWFPKPFLGRCYVVGSFLAVGRTLFERVGGFDPGFFLYYEEAELCRRLHEAADIPFCANQVGVLHEAFGSYGNLDEVYPFEARGFLDYCRITRQPQLLKRRLKHLHIIGLIEPSVRKREATLKAACGRNGIAPAEC
jgi:GT2 family glycosyltransferase